MTKRIQRRHTTALHLPTSMYFEIIGARRCEAGDTFVCRQDGSLRERLFLVDGFDLAAAGREALFETLIAKEVARSKAAEKKARALEVRKHAKERDADEEEKANQWNEQTDSLELTDDDSAHSEVISETISQEDTHGFESLESLDIEQEEFETAAD
jgi:hypothetical protein